MVPRAFAISCLLYYTPSAVNPGQEMQPLKGLLAVGVERVIPLVQSKCDVVTFETVSLARDMTSGKRCGSYRGAKTAAPALWKEIWIISQTFWVSYRVKLQQQQQNKTQPHET